MKKQTEHAANMASNRDPLLGWSFEAYAAFSGGQAIAEKMCLRFRRAWSGEVAAIEEALELGDLRLAADRAHYFNSTCAGINALGHVKTVVDIENGLRRGDERYSRELLAELRGRLKKLDAHLAEALGQRV